jgi:uncharacterized sulfatase
MRFERAFTTCPLCTPARSSIFTGLHPQVNGAWCNNQAPGLNIAHMGAIFRQAGYRAAHTGKWHLDGSGYFGDGEAGFCEEWIWGKRVADRAIDFLEKVCEAPFLLVVSFDEPHAPYVPPPEYWEKFGPQDIPRPPNYLASLEGKPEMQRIHHEQLHGGRSWDEFSQGLVSFFGCNHFIDGQIGGWSKRSSACTAKIPVFSTHRNTATCSARTG